MKSKISRTLISTFSFPLLSISVSNKACRRCIILKAFGMAVLTILTLTGVAGASPFAYIENVESNNVSVIDTSTDTVTATVPVGSYPQEVAVTPDGNEVYVVNYGSNTTSVIDTTTNNVNTTVHVGGSPTAVGIGPVVKSSSTTESNSTSFLNPVNRTRNQTSNTGVTENAGAAGKQEKESVPTQASKDASFLSPIWVLVAVLRTVAFVRMMR